MKASEQAQTTHRMFMKDSIGVVPPPHTHTVKKTMRRVLENVIRRAYVDVSRMARANAIAPRRPVSEIPEYGGVKGYSSRASGRVLSPINSLSTES